MHSRSALGALAKLSRRFSPLGKFNPLFGITADRSVFPHEVIGK
jgi:hypothetical protein